MGIFETIMAKIFGGGDIVKTATEAFMAYFPPEMAPEKKAEIALAFATQKANEVKDGLVAAHEMDAAFNKRIVDLEGTAADLKSIPFLGNVLLFLRGSQRPVWGFGVLYLDFMWFSKAWDIPDNTQKSVAFIIINILVLGFLFGERALQNVIPYITQFFGAKQAAK